jgi:hypothetical protein
MYNFVSFPPNFSIIRRIVVIQLFRLYSSDKIMRLRLCNIAESLKAYFNGWLAVIIVCVNFSPDDLRLATIPGQVSSLP